LKKKFFLPLQKGDSSVLGSKKTYFRVCMDCGTSNSCF
jgi:hypothetical protein